MVGTYQFARRHPGNLGRLALACDACNKYSPAGHPALRGLGNAGRLRGLGDTGLPAGSRLSYTATWDMTGTNTLQAPNAVQSAIQQQLASQYGIVIDSQSHTTSDIINISGSNGFTLQVHTLSDRNSQDDVKAIIDGALYGLSLSNIKSQIITIAPGVSSSPSGPPLLPGTAAANANAIAAAQAGYSDAIARGDNASAAAYLAQIQTLTAATSSPASWLSSNWPLLALGFGVVVVAKEVL